MRRTLLVVLLLCAGLSGCISGGGDSNDLDEDDPFQAPVWEVGDWWLYTFTTPEFSDDTARLGVTEEDAEGGTAYMLGISNHIEARRYAVLNHNPFLGRITHDNLSTFENGVPQPVFMFPFQKGDYWNFTLFSTEWDASVTEVIFESNGVTKQRLALITSSAADGSRLDYMFDESSGFLRSMVWTDSSGVVQLNMQQATFGTGHQGEVWFIRGGDLYSGSWEHSSGLPEIEVRDTFFVSDHPSGDSWDQMIYWLSAEMGGGSSTGTLTLRDHTSATALARQWGPGAAEQGQLGTIPYPSGDYTLTLTLTGDASVSIIVAGGITESWML